MQTNWEIHWSEREFNALWEKQIPIRMSLANHEQHPIQPMIFELPYWEHLLPNSRDIYIKP